MVDQNELITNRNIGSVQKTYGYIHIWASPGEIRVHCTEPQTIRVLIRAIKKTFREVKIESRDDLTGQVYAVKMTCLEPEEQHQKLAWWLFKMMCNHGWEPMETGEHWYKMRREGLGNQ